MANPYCDLIKLAWFLDTRSFGMLGNDVNATTNADTTIAQGQLDAAAGELESHLSGRVTLPLTSVPLVLTRWVAVKAAETFYGRRGDLPKQVKSAVDWADQWIKDFDAGRTSIDGAARLGPDELLDELLDDQHHANCRLERVKRELTEGL